MSGNGLWDRYQAYRCDAPDLGLSLDISRVRFDADYLDRMRAAMANAMDAMEALESGAIANPDERRMVGHYWLRSAERAPTEQIRRSISSAVASVQAFATAAHAGAVQGARGPFAHLIHVGIGGSSLGAQLICDVLRTGRDRIAVHFLDNADPDGIDQLVERLDGALGQTLVSVVSKSGWTPTPWHVLLELEAAYRRRGLDLARHAVATTVGGTALDRRAIEQGWLARFPLWDWVGGRTSVTSAVGLFPAAMQGVDVASFLRGAAAMDCLTRHRELRRNQAALLALAWYWLGNGRGDRDMVVLPYRDRLATLGRYVQQLVMESIGKELDRSGRVVHQGLTVYGNKGSTDQHAYVQQLRDGPNNFFAIFIHVQDDRTGPSMEVEPGLTLGDFLFGYLEGTRRALYERGRDSITITLPDLSPATLGALIALFERAVGLYAELVDVNAYHQPGVDKRAAASVVQLQRVVLGHLERLESPQTAGEIAWHIGRPEEVETVFKVLERLARDPRRGVVAAAGPTPFAARFVPSRLARPDAPPHQQAVGPGRAVGS
ncbi:MAG: glucose-6-phosphate isomerase [Planctomycetes bacterium]|nr:glucose-6-phosphate isomerase [Planctomycetota bacterium]